MTVVQGEEWTDEFKYSIEGPYENRLVNQICVFVRACVCVCVHAPLFVCLF